MKYFAGKVQRVVLFENRNATSLEESSAKIKSLRSENCP